MKTTELFVEQILIGFLVLIVGALPHWAELSSRIKSLNTIEGVWVSASVMGMAYLAGMIFDRVADTLLQGIDSHNRLRFALRGLTAPPRRGDDDPFPEDLLRIRTQLAGGGVNEWSDYLRSRIRLARALAAFLPALTFSAVLTVAGAPHSRWLLAFVPLCYVTPLLFGVLIERWKDLPKAPRTDDPEAVARYAEARKIFKKDSAWLQLVSLSFDIIGTPGVWPLLVLLFGAFTLALAVDAEASQKRVAILLAVLGFGLTVLALWTWWRISQTFMAHLRAFQHAGK